MVRIINEVSATKKKANKSTEYNSRTNQTGETKGSGTYILSSEKK